MADLLVWSAITTSFGSFLPESFHQFSLDKLGFNKSFNEDDVPDILAVSVRFGEGLLEVISSEENPWHALLLLQPSSLLFFLCSLCFLFFPPFLFEEDEEEDREYLPSLLFKEDELPFIRLFVGETYRKGSKLTHKPKLPYLPLFNVDMLDSTDHLLGQGSLLLFSEMGKQEALFEDFQVPSQRSHSRRLSRTRTLRRAVRIVVA